MLIAVDVLSLTQRANVSEACVYATNRRTYYTLTAPNVPHLSEQTSKRTNEQANDKHREGEEHKTSLPYRRAEIINTNDEHCYSCIRIWLGLYPTSMHRRSCCMHIYIHTAHMYILGSTLPFDGFSMRRVCLSVCCTLSVFVVAFIRFKIKPVEHIMLLARHGCCVVVPLTAYGLRMQHATFPLRCRGQCNWVF